MWDEVTVSGNGRNAFNTISKAEMLAQVRQHTPAASRFAYFFYAGTLFVYFGKEIILCCTLQQGCKLAGLSFALTAHPVYLELSSLGALLVAAYSDNGYFVTLHARQDIPRARQIIRSVGQRVGFMQVLSLSWHLLWRLMLLMHCNGH